MTRRLHLLTPLVVLAFAATVFAADDPPKPSTEVKGTDNYYPINMGTTWHYKIGEKKAVAKVTDQKKEGNLTVATIETFVDGGSSPVATEQIAHAPEGIIRVSYNSEKPKTPVLILKAAP